MKRYLFSLLALCSAAVAMADEPFKAGFSSVEIRTRNGETTTITLTDAMTTTFTETDAIFSDGNDVVSIPLAQLRTYTFVAAVVPEGITAPVVSGHAEFFSVDGRPLESLVGAPEGTYIVRSGQTTFKIYHKH